MLLTTQYLEEADRLADRIAVLEHGAIVAEGTAAELKARVGGEVLALHDADGDARARGAHRRHARRPARGARRALDDAGCRHPSSLRTPSLDDVFLAVTGSHPPPPTRRPEGLTAMTTLTAASAADTAQPIAPTPAPRASASTGTFVAPQPPAHAAHPRRAHHGDRAADRS